MKNEIKRVLVTGATGHIGYNICMAILESKIELINQATFDGEKYVGEFREGKLWNTIRYDKEEMIIGK